MTTIKKVDNGLINGYLKYFYDIPTVCPYGVGEEAVYRQAQFGFVDDPLMSAFIESGFRRNGNSIYTMSVLTAGHARPFGCRLKSLMPIVPSAAS